MGGCNSTSGSIPHGAEVDAQMAKVITTSKRVFAMSLLSVLTSW
jgi:hypothetical protein